jgi:hypothetical protein
VSKAKDVTVHGKSLPCLWRHLQQQGLYKAIAAAGPGLVLVILNLILLNQL